MTGPAPGTAHGLSHVLGFIVSGLIALAVDVTVTKLAAVWLGLPWFASRLLAIAVAMVAAWACHRRLTFRIATPPTVGEFVAYAGMAWSAAALNYVVFLGVLWFAPALDVAIAIAAASVVAMTYSYLAMRFGVFRHS